jgi:acylphosphatase
VSVIRRVVVSGRVQGVGYRAFVADQAAARTVEGWVRNRRDGTVEAVFAGSAQSVDQVIAACRKGPWGTGVDGVEVHDGSAAELALRQGETFAVLPTV